VKPADIRIRKANQADFTTVAEMHYPVWRQSWRGILADDMLDTIATPNRWAAVDYPRNLILSGWSMWIAEFRGKVIGMTIFGPYLGRPDQLQIDALYIATENQYCGVGGLLLDQATRCNPSRDVISWCAEKNYRAREFHETKGFRPDGRTFNWEPLPGVIVPHLGYRLYRSAPQF
jgi:L-amino acid N-acyltransferase YncA